MRTLTANLTRFALLAIVLSPAVCSAQALPIVPHSPNVLSRTTTRDEFRARPDTYLPRDEPGLLFPVSAGVWPVWSAPQPAPVIIVIQPPPAAAPAATVAPAPAPPPPVVTLPAPAPPQQRATPKTLYVIPGCYAGDRLPRPDQLRPGCSLRNIRTISPAP